MEGTVSADWAWLPTDLLDLIADRIVELSDFIRFGSVCKSWHAVTHQCRTRQQLLHLTKTCRNKLPMLMIPNNGNSKDNQSLYSVTDRAVYQIQMPMPCDRRFSGSSQGWLFMVDKSMNITLIDLFLNKTVVLPKFKVRGGEYSCQYNDSFQYNKYDDHDYFIVKAILLPATPQNQVDDFEVWVIYGGMLELAYLKSRDTTWNRITPKASDRVKVFSDIVSYKGQVYAVSFWSALVLIDVKARACKVLIKATNVEAEATYVVESHYGSLLLVRRFVDYCDVKNMHKTVRFEVFKLSWGITGKPDWVKLENIGEQALFLGGNSSMSISTRDFPQCKPNCIYYVDDYIAIHNKYIPRVDDDSGIYNMEDKSFSKHYAPDPSFFPSLPPIWIVPKLKKKI